MYKRQVHAEDGVVYECRAKGIFRKEKIKPLPGDNVEISPVQDEEKPAGNVDAILPRKNVLIRPAVANVDPVSYTHLDVYKRQRYFRGAHQFKI